MLTFSSACNDLVDTAEAVRRAVEVASTGHDLSRCVLVVFHVTLGHEDDIVGPILRQRCATARIVGCTAAGVIGREGALESMRSFGLMLVFGDGGDVEVACVESLQGRNSESAAAALARQLVATGGPPRFSLFLGSGIDVDCDGVISGIESVLGETHTVFGGTSADNMRGISSFQFADDQTFVHGAMLVGFYDPTLSVVTQASHGFVPSGVTMTVTAAEGNRVYALDGEPAWRVFTRNLGYHESAVPGDTIPPGAVGVALDDEAAVEYGDRHLLRVITHRFPDGSLLMPTGVVPGTLLWLMRRDEERIFRNLALMMDSLTASLAGADVVAVFHADCGARGRLTLDRVAKEEIVSAMQAPLHVQRGVPPWLGMYGFGEFARLAGRNRFHNYTTALYVLYRA